MLNDTPRKSDWCGGGANWHGVPMKAMRRVAFPFWLAGSRLRRRRGSLLLVVLGLAAATAMLAAVLAGTTAAEDREVGRQVAQVPAKVRAVRVNCSPRSTRCEKKVSTPTATPADITFHP